MATSVRCPRLWIREDRPRLTLRRATDTVARRFALCRRFGFVVGQAPGMGIDRSLGVAGDADQGQPVRVGEIDRLAGRQRPGSDELESGPPGLEGDVGA